MAAIASRLISSSLSRSRLERAAKPAAHQQIVANRSEAPHLEPALQCRSLDVATSLLSVPMCQMSLLSAYECPLTLNCEHAFMQIGSEKTLTWVGLASMELPVEYAATVWAIAFGLRPAYCGMARRTGDIPTRD